MKKIINLFILSIICILPIMVDAKAKFELESELNNKFLLEIVDGKYTFIDSNYDAKQSGSVVVLNSKGEELKKDSFIPENEDDLAVLLNTPYMKKYLEVMYDIEGYSVIMDDTSSYSIMYDTEKISFNNTTTGETGTLTFSDNLDQTRKILGKKYDIFLEVKKAAVTVDHIREYNGYFIVYYHNDNGNYVSIMDSNYNKIKTFEESAASNYIYYAYDNLIYIMKNNKDIEIYKADGTLYQTYKIENDKIADETTCGSLYPVKILIENNQMFILFIPKECEEPVSASDAAEELLEEPESAPQLLTLVYNLDYEIEKVEPSNGSFTYQSKIDENGRKYVELKITPEKGYSVENILVTDASGKSVEVNNNKFYMPASDVKIRVKFMSGEYVPIPDTFSKLSPLIQIFSILLIGSGMYIIYFAVKSKKVN